MISKITNKIHYLIIFTVALFNGINVMNKQRINYYSIQTKLALMNQYIPFKKEFFLIIVLLL